jgi:pentatricopeptide repeat protein
MESSGIEPNVYSYNQLLKGICKANHPDKAYLFMVTMMNPKGFCDAVSYNTFIKEFCSICDTRRAFKLRKWGERGLPQM